MCHKGGGPVPDVYHISVRCALNMAVAAPDKDRAREFVDQCYFAAVDAGRVLVIQKAEIGKLLHQADAIRGLGQSLDVASRHTEVINSSRESLDTMKISMTSMGPMDERDTINFRGYYRELASMCTTPAHVANNAITGFAAALSIVDAAAAGPEDDDGVISVAAVRSAIASTARTVELGGDEMAASASLPATSSTTTAAMAAPTVAAAPHPDGAAAEPKKEWPLSRWVAWKKLPAMSIERLKLLGRFVAAAYRLHHGRDAKPPTRDGYPDGAARDVNCYTEEDLSIIQEGYGDMLHADSLTPAQRAEVERANKKRARDKRAARKRAGVCKSKLRTTAAGAKIDRFLRSQQKK